MQRRITSAAGTIPANTALAGTVTSFTDTTKLHYTGSDDVASKYSPGKISSVDSPSWIYVYNGGAGAPYIARVIGLFKNAPADYTIYLDRAFAGCTGSSCAYLPGPITFSYQVDGGGAAHVCSGDKGSVLTIINTGEGDNSGPYQRYVGRNKLKTPVYIVAEGTDVLIDEEI
jgi:hypothetical protein